MRSTREWFVSRQSANQNSNQVQGPFSTTQIRDQLAQGTLTPLDQICQAGAASDLQWKLIFEMPEFIAPSTTPNVGATASASRQAAEWVLLRQTITGQFSLKRSGPYTLDDIALMLREGSIQFSDYVWKKGFQRWAQLETLREFNHSLPQEAPKLELVRNDISKDAGAQLADNEADEQEPFQLFEQASVAAIAPLKIAQDVTQSNQGASIWARAGIAFIISLGVMLGLAALKPWRKSSIQSAARGRTSLDAATTGEEGYLTIQPLDMDTHPKIEFQMSAPAKTFLQVRLTGHEGQILHRMRFDKTITLQRHGAEQPVLDLMPLGLPEGTYEVTVTDGRIRTQQQVFVGAHDAQFERALAAHREEIAREQLIERRAVYDLASQLSILVDHLPAQGSVGEGEWSEHYAKWTANFQRLTRSESFDQAAGQSAEPALIQAAQGVAKAVHDQAEAFNAAAKSHSAAGAVVQTAALKNQLRRLQAQASVNRN